MIPGLFMMKTLILTFWEIQSGITRVHFRELIFQKISKQPDMKQSAMQLIDYCHLRFAFSPGSIETLQKFDDLFAELGYDEDFDATDYQTSSNQAAALGNYIAQCINRFWVTRWIK